MGKTTLACADAVAAAHAGSKVLIASVDQAHSLGDALGFHFPHDPGTITGITSVLPGLDVIEVDSLALLEDRFREVVTTLSHGAGHRHGLVDRGSEHGFDITALDPAELTGLPGVQELLVLVEIAQFAADADWDVIVVDCPPSADMLRLVTAPETLLHYLDRVWPPHARAMSVAGTDLRTAVLAHTVERIAKAVGEVRDLLADRRRTGACLVTVAEQVAVAESARVRSAAALLGLRLDAVVVNKILPPVPPPSSRAEAENPAVRWYSERRAEQLEVLAQLRESMCGVRVLVAEHTGREPIGPSSLARLSCHGVARDEHGATGSDDSAKPGAGRSDGDSSVRALMLGANQTDDDREPRDRVHEDRPGDVPDSGAPEVRWESGSGLHSVYTLRMHLPVVDPATLRLGRVEDDLIVGADGVRRRVRLAPVLRRCAVEGAELDRGRLLVRFRPDPHSWPDAREGHGHGQ
ncbi:ArsA family ATPase [Nocardia callitridis]|uniref:ArsA family ATPase n=1 Tax=Nocardia callitridis TaxID=648753 RepID=A0ABP9KH06_9NOCA